MQPKEIIQSAINKYRPKAVLLLFSGGHDSLISTHLSASILQNLNIPFKVYHGDTSIYIQEARDYVESVCCFFKWDLVIRQPEKGERYEDIVKKHGFPGPSLMAHGIMYRRLKERALRRYISHEIKTRPKSKENVLLITGARQQESKVRMGYRDAVKKEASKIWCAPIFKWSKARCEKYMSENKLPRSIVKDTIGISGECLCGCFADKGEFDRIAQYFPEAADKIDDLHDLATDNGKPWFWTQGPTQWDKMYPPGQYSLDLGMCSNCSRITNPTPQKTSDANS